MKRILHALVAIAAVGVLAYAGPARACGAQQKTTTSKADEQEKVQPQKAAGAKQTDKEAKAQQKTSGAQAKNEASPARPEQR